MLTSNAFMLLFTFLAILLVLAYPMGAWMTRILDTSQPSGRRSTLLERGIYRVCGIDPAEDMSWKRYAIALLVFSLVGVLVVYAMQRLQGLLPFNPQALGAVTPDSAFNTAVSFVTNTNWQGYGGETTMSYLTQMLGLTVQNVPGDPVRRCAFRPGEPAGLQGRTGGPADAS